MPPVEPFKIKIIEPINIPNQKQRTEAIKRAGYNTFLLKSGEVYIDMLTDSGTSAMSIKQLGRMISEGDESYAGSINFYNLLDSVNNVLGYKYVIPTHQGRGAEHILSKILITKKEYIVPRNMYFTTSKAHVELVGGEMVDIIIPEAYDPENKHPFKGNVDIKKLEDLLSEHSNKIPYINIEMDVNMAGGQPISMSNLKAVRSLANEFDKLVIFDATRSSENAFFIKEREKEYKNKSIIEILREMMSYSDGCIYSAKKDCLVNIGGFIATNNKEIYQRSKELVVVYEGLHTYGGMAGRDMEAVAIGLLEGANEDYLRHRIHQVRYLGEMLLKNKVPIVNPIGGHGVFLNAKKILPHISKEEWVSQTLASAIYEDSAVRTMERGSVSKGRDKKTGKNLFSKLELVRIAIPRRVYTNTHMEYVADSILRIYENKDQITGLRMIYEPKVLRFFQARFVKK